MKQQTLTMNGIDFEYCGKTTASSVTSMMYRGYNWDEIRDVYVRPSETKVEIWHDWCNWVDEINSMMNICNTAIEAGIQITSHNSMQFSIGGYVKGANGKLYRIWITAMHNRIYEVEI